MRTESLDGSRPPSSDCGNCEYVRTRRFGWVLKHNPSCPQHGGTGL